MKNFIRNLLIKLVDYLIEKYNIDDEKLLERYNKAKVNKATNREKINQLSNKELAKVLANAQDACYYCSYGDNTNCNCNIIQCENNILEYLNQESEE